MARRIRYSAEVKGRFPRLLLNDAVPRERRHASGCGSLENQFSSRVHSTRLTTLSIACARTHNSGGPWLA